MSIVVRAVCKAINSTLGPRLIVKKVMHDFQEKFGFPVVPGCIDDTHIPIRQPSENSYHYFCYQMKYSINVQATCNEVSLQMLMCHGQVMSCCITQFNNVASLLVKYKEGKRSWPSSDRRMERGKADDWIDKQRL